MSSEIQNTETQAPEFTPHSIEVNGLRINYLDAGQGQPVVILRDSEVPAPSSLEKLLVWEFRVLSFAIAGLDTSAGDEPPFSPQELARALARTAGSAERFALVTAGAGAPLALRAVLELSEQVDALVLISPVPVFEELRGVGRDVELAHRLAGITAPTLLLLGTEDQVIPQQTGRMYAEQLPNCYYVLVWDAGHDIEAERPETLFAAVRDFLERRETFVVNRASTILNP
jgi:pimeloyl-ACP methyl ester carboxylesterase